jgi:Flp pilus assembly pilin Flp
MMNFINTQIVNVQAALHVAKDSLMDRAEGQAMVEYGLILVLVSVVAIVGLTVVGGQLYNPNAALTSGAGVTPLVWATGSTKVPGIFNTLIAYLSGETKGA